MPKRSPLESYRKRQQAANSKYLDIWLSKSHPCVCGHVQGFHWPDDVGECVGKCGDADCGCTAFDHGIHLQVSTDGQSWFGHRRTVAGWVLGIGSSGAPPNRYYFDGLEPPVQFAAEGDAWPLGSEPSAKLEP